jgi:copper resistance protein D
LAWISLVLTAASGFAWFVLVAASMSERPAAEVFSAGILWVVLLQTDFGHAWLIRALLVVLLAAVFAFALTTKPKRSAAIWLNVIAAAMAAGLVGILAWGGHAAGGAGTEGIVHPAADFLHLTAGSGVGRRTRPAGAVAWAGRPRCLIDRDRADRDASLLRLRPRERRDPHDHGPR